MIVVGVALEREVKAGEIPHAETLARSAAQQDVERRIGHPGIAVPARDLSRKARPDGSIEILDFEAEPSARLALDRRQARLHHLLGQLAFVEGFVVRRRAELRRVFCQAVDR